MFVIYDVDLADGKRQRQPKIGNLKEQLAAKDEALRLAQVALVKNEYILTKTFDGEDFYCAECGTLKGYSHTENCSIAIALKAVL